MTTYTLFGQPPSPATLIADTSDYTMGMEFSLSSSAQLTGIWFYSAPGAVSLPAACCIFAVSGHTQVSGTVNTSPSWSGAAGSGWVKCPYDGTVTLSASTNYRVAMYHGAAENWYSATAHYWDTGPGASGLTSGIISAPGAATADAGNQDAFQNPSIGLTYPTASFNAANYWIDVEVTTTVAHTATASLTVTPSFSAATSRGHSRSASLTVTPSFSAARTRGHSRTAALTVTPAFSAARNRARFRTAALLVTPGFSAARTAGRFRHASLTVTPAFSVTAFGGRLTPVMFGLGRARYRWALGRARNGGEAGMVLTQSAISTQLVQVQVQAILLGAVYNPTADQVQMAFVPATYIPANPAPSQWQPATWETDPGPVYWAQCLVGPANGGLTLAAGSYMTWVKVTDNPEVPALPGPSLLIT